MKINEILSQIDLGHYALPEFQRGYVWNREQVKNLIRSLYLGYPIGGLLVWVTNSNSDITRGEGQLSPGVVNLILDGQQRITSLYGVFKGHAPLFFDGNSNAFTGLYFNIKEEVFEFYTPLKMRDNHEWISVTELLQLGASNYIASADINKKMFLFDHLSALNKLDNIRDTELHIQTVTGDDKTIDVVVEIFNNVNSGGTKLSKGDLALAKICSQWPEGRNEMKRKLRKLSNAGYCFSLDWLLRSVTVYMTGRPYFSELDKVCIVDFKKALEETSNLIGLCLDHIGSRLGLDHDRVLPSKHAIITMIGYLRRQPSIKLSNQEWNKLMYWYVHTFLWGRYAGSTESVLAQDLNILANDEGIDGLIKILRQQRGDLEVKSDDFKGWSTGARFYPLLYLLTRVNHARDFGSGVELTHSLLGKNSTLEVHHIFPKHRLYEAGFNKSQVNSLANYAFLTKETNLEISNRFPSDYLAEYYKKHPGTIESNWIPVDSSLWQLDRYEDFLEKRRELLAEGTNEFLASLYSDAIENKIIEDFVNREVQIVRTEDEEQAIIQIAYWMTENGLPGGERNYVIQDSGKEIVIDLAWPDGVQVGLSKPLALLLNETEDVYIAANKAGYSYITDIEQFKEYISANYL